MKLINNRKLWWVVFALSSVVLFLGYLFSYLSHHLDPYLNTYLKGLSVLQHFGIHYPVGIVAGMLLILLYRVWTQKTLNEPLVLTITTLISHWPDIRFAYRGLPHEPWEIIFLFHTVADESFMVFWISMLVSILLITYYRRLIKKYDN